MTRLALIVPDVGWRPAYRAANLLLRLDVPVCWTLDDATDIVDARGHVTHLPRGSFVVGEDAWVPRRAMHAISALIERVGGRTLAGDVSEGSLLRLRAAPVAVYGGGGAPFHHLSALRRLGFDADPIMPEHIRLGALARYAAMAVPGGGWQAMQGQLAPLGSSGVRAIAAFVRRGGLYLGSCAGAYSAALTPTTFRESCPEQQEMQLINAAVWNTGDAAWGGLQSPGIGVVEVEGVRNDHPVLFNLPTRFRLTHYNGPIFAPADGSIPGASAASGLVRFAGVTPDFTSAEDFLGDRTPGPRLVERAIAEGLFSVVHGELDAGGVLLCGSHPEFGYTPSLDGLEDGALLLANALLWHTATRPAGIAAAVCQPPAWPANATDAQPPRAYLPAIARHLSQLETARPEYPWWLEPRHSMAVFGRPAQEIWEGEIRRLASLVDRIDDSLDRVGDLVQRTRAESGAALQGEQALERVARDTLYRPDAAQQQDGGYRGVGALLEDAVALLRRAVRLRTSEAPPPPPTPYHAYQDAWRNPYHLVAGSYLAAAGLLTGADLLLRSDIACLDDALLLHELDDRR